MIDHCPVCDYSLEGLPEAHTCPECGFGYEKDSEVLCFERRSQYRIFRIVFALVILFGVLEWFAGGTLPLFVVVWSFFFLIYWLKSHEGRRLVVVSPRSVRCISADRSERSIRLELVHGVRRHWVDGHPSLLGADGKEIFRIDMRHLLTRKASIAVVALIEKKLAEARRWKGEPFSEGLLAEPIVDQGTAEG